MATYYWVGGSGNWDATSTTNWATSSGGAGGAGVPTSVDDVIFDANSNVGTGAFTVTVTGDSTNPAVCRDFSTGGAGGALDGAMTLSLGATAFLDVYGSMTLPATNLTWSGTFGCFIRLRGTGSNTITTNGVSFGATTIACLGSGTWTLGSAFTSTATLDWQQGTLNTNNFNITTTQLLLQTANAKTINAGSSTITLSSATAFTYSGSNLTFNAGTSTISCSNASPTFTGGGLTFYNVSFTSTATGTVIISGDNTFNNLTFTSRSATGTRLINIQGDLTVNGTLTIGAANQYDRRLQVITNNIGVTRTITVNGTVATLADIDIRDITAAGTFGTWSGTRLGNGLGCTNITFDTPKTVYWNLAAGGNWTSNAWALSSGGGVSTANYPLAQDTVIIENTGLNTGATVTYNFGWWVGELDCSTRSNAMTLASGTGAVTYYKNVTFSSAMTHTGTGTYNFYGSNTTQVLDVNGSTIAQALNIFKPSGTFQIAENTTSNLGVTLGSGTLDLSNNTLTCLTFASTNSNTRTIAFGTGNITVSGNNAAIFNTDIATNLTLSGTPVVNATYSGATGTRQFLCGTTSGTQANSFSINITAGTDTVITGAANRFYLTLNFTGFNGTFSAGSGARTLFGNLIFSNTMTISAGSSITTFAATSGTQQITSNGQTLDFPITQNSPGATVQLQDNLTMGSTRAFTLTAGTIDVNSKTLTCGAFSSSNSNSRTVAMGTNGKIEVNGGNWTATTSTNLTLTGTGTIDMTSVSSKTFAGGGVTYPYTLNQGGLGALTITGANTFANISNSVQPCTITFPAAATTYVQNFTVSGTSGNLVTLNSSTPGTQWTLAKV